MDGTRFGVSSLFTKKLRLAQYADGTIYDYRLKISQAVLYLNKLPDDFTQEDIDDYLSMLLDRNRYSISFFKHTIFGLKSYYEYMGLKEPGELVLPRVRKPKRLPRVLSQEQMKRLIGLCDLYDKALLSTLHCLAHWSLTEAVCEMHVFVDRFVVLLCAVNSVFCIIFDQF